VDVSNDPKQQVKTMIVERLRLKVSPDAIDDAAPLFRDGLGLDSIDALELVVAVEEEFGVVIESEREARRVLASVAALTQFLIEKGVIPA
jgi:acyl carrier protein